MGTALRRRPAGARCRALTSRRGRGAAPPEAHPRPPAASGSGPRGVESEAAAQPRYAYAPGPGGERHSEARLPRGSGSRVRQSGADHPSAPPGAQDTKGVHSVHAVPSDSVVSGGRSVSLWTVVVGIVLQEPACYLVPPVLLCCQDCRLMPFGRVAPAVAPHLPLFQIRSGSSSWILKRDTGVSITRYLASWIFNE